MKSNQGLAILHFCTQVRSLSITDLTVCLSNFTDNFKIIIFVNNYIKIIMVICIIFFDEGLEQHSEHTQIIIIFK